MENVDQKVLAEDVSSKINYETLRMFLVKPLDPIMVKKEFSTPVPTEVQNGKDENGIEATDYETVETEIKEVESDFRKGIVLKVPFDYTKQVEDDNYHAYDIKVGDTVIYRARNQQWFDLLKDTQLVELYSIIAVEK